MGTHKNKRKEGRNIGYTTFSTAGKSQIKSEDIGAGQIDLHHLSPALYTELRKVGTHNHSGQNSRQVNLQNLTGAFGTSGFKMYSADGTQFAITVSNAGALVVTEI